MIWPQAPRPRRGRGGLLALALILLAVMPAAAPAQEAVEQRALLDLIVNEAPWGTVQVVLRPGDVLVPVEALEAAGLRAGAQRGRREVLGDVEHVSLAALAPALSWEVDEVDLTLRVTVDPAVLERTVLDLAVGPPPEMVYSQDPAAFLNYAVSWGDLETLDLFGEAGLSRGESSFLSTFSAREARGFLRGLSRLAWDDRDRLRRWELGDQLASARNPLGGSVLLGGLGLTRDFGLDPYLVRHPTPDLEGVLATPSLVEVYVNGLLVRREQLPPGEFELRNLPVASGQGEARLVIRDAFGRVREVASPFSFTTGLLARGLSEYGYYLGARREHLATESFDYGEPAFLGQHRVGLTDRMTVGASLEAGDDLLSGGPHVTLRAGAGELTLAGALSEQEGERGSAGYASYSYSGRQLGLGGSVRRLSDRFANLGLPATADRPLLDVRVFLGLSPGQRLGITLEAGSRDYRDRPDQEDVRLAASLRLTDRATLLLVGGRMRRLGGLLEDGSGEVLEDRISLGLSYFLGRNTTAKLYGDFESGDDRQGVEVQKSLPVGRGYAYRFTADRVRGRADLEGEVQAQNRFGRYEVTHLDVGGQQVTNVTAAGALVAVGGALHATRPVQESFAVIRVPGVEGVRGYLSNQEVGRTDDRGDLLVPNLLPWFGNRLSIADQDVPLDHVVEERERVVAPPARGGAVVTFPVWRLRALTATLAVASGEETRVPSAGRLTVTAAGRIYASPVGRAGEVYLENIPPGEHPAVLETDEGTCLFRIVVPDSDRAVVDLGRMVCRR